jgi:rubrerythrin
MFITEKNIKLELEKIKRRVEEIHYCVECGNACKGDYYYCPYCGFTIM